MLCLLFPFLIIVIRVSCNPVCSCVPRYFSGYLCQSPSVLCCVIPHGCASLCFSLAFPNVVYSLYISHACNKAVFWVHVLVSTYESASGSSPGCTQPFHDIAVEKWRVSVGALGFANWKCLCLKSWTTFVIIVNKVNKHFFTICTVRATPLFITGTWHGDRVCTKYLCLSQTCYNVSWET